MTPAAIMGIDGRLLYLGLYEGTVIAIEPGGRRVKVRIDGLASDTGWARPKTAGGGGNRRGGHLMPAIGNTVFISFVNGELRAPVYEGGAWGDSEAPNDITYAGAEKSEQVQGFEIVSEKAALRLTYDERDGSRSFRLFAFAKEFDGSETVIGGLEIDIEKRVVGIYGLAGIILRSKGMIRLDSIAQLIGRRHVRQGSPAPL